MRLCLRLAILPCALFLLGADGCGPISIPRPEGGCPPPTWEQCATPTTQCDFYLRQQARSEPESACALLFEQKALSEATRYEKVPALGTRLFKPGSPARDTAPIVEVRKIPGDRSTLEVTGLNGFALGATLRDAALLPSGSAAAQSRQVFRLLRRAQWIDNGIAVKSCEEYVYEKFYDYTVFEDQVVRVGLENHRAIYERAFATGSPAPVSAIGTRHLDGSSLKGRDGRPFDAAVPFTTLPKNQFFTAPRPKTDAQVSFVKGPADRVDYFPGTKRVRITLAHLQRQSLNFVGVDYDDETLAATLEPGRSYYQESFDWHRQMGQRNASLLDEEMAVWDARQDAFLELLRVRDETAEEMALLFDGDSAPPVATGGGVLTRWWADPVWNPDPTKVSLGASRTFDVRGATLTGSAAISANLPPNPFNFAPTFITYASPPAGGSQTLQQPEPVASAPFKAAQVVAACTGNRIICLAYRLAYIDQAIEQQLQAARAAGCLDTANTSGPRVCDWSPRRFSQRVVGLFQEEREKVHQRCTSYLSDFAPIESRSLVFENQQTLRKVDYPTEDYTVSAVKLEQFFTRYDEYIDVLVEAVGPLMDRNAAPGQPPKVRLRNESSEVHTIGNKYFGAELAYTFGFEANDVINPDRCKVQQAMYGRIAAKGKAVGIEATLLDGDLTVSGNKAKVRLEVLGSELINEDEDLPGTAFNVVRGGDGSTQTFAQGQLTVVIGFIPITFKGQVAGTVAFQYSLDAGLLTSGGGASCSLVRAGVSGSVKPLLLVQATASAAVDAVVASAGVKGSLTLISLFLPLTGSASVGPAQDDPLQLDFVAEVGAELRFTFFSGSVSVFLEIGVCPLCESIEEPLFTWDGLRYKIPLFDTRVRCRLGDLTAVAQALGVAE